MKTLIRTLGLLASGWMAVTLPLPDGLTRAGVFVALAALLNAGDLRVWLPTHWPLGALAVAAGLLADRGALAPLPLMGTGALLGAAGWAVRPYLIRLVWRARQGEDGIWVIPVAPRYRNGPPGAWTVGSSLFATETLYQQLRPAEVAAILTHERRHLHPLHQAAYAAHAIATPALWAALFWYPYLTLAGAIAWPFISRALERDADRHVAESAPDVAEAVSAYVKLAAEPGGSLTHPPLRQRLALLTGDPNTKVDLLRSPLLDRYGLRDWALQADRLDLAAGLFYLEMLERALHEGGVTLPNPVTAVEAGPGPWFYRRPLEALLARYDGQNRHLQLEAVDPAPQTDGVITGDFRTYSRQVDLCLMLFPFVWLSDHKRAGLDRKLFDPEGMLRHAWSLLKPGGALIIANPGEDEREEQHRLLACLDLQPSWWAEHRSEYFRYSEPRFVTVVRKA